MSSEAVLSSIEARLHSIGAHPERGGDFDNWDLKTYGGMFGSGRMLLAVEEHGQGKQMLLIKQRPVISTFVVTVSCLLFAAGAAMATLGAWLSGALLIIAGGSLLLRAIGDVVAAMCALSDATKPLAEFGIETDRK